MADGTFDPRRHLSSINGNPYLEVKWRLVWLRDDHPDAEVTTDLVKRTDGCAIFRASVALPSGGSATGYGSETLGDFPDYIEKAETKAIGRALQALGYGTPEPFRALSGGAVGELGAPNRLPVPAAATPRRDHAAADLAVRHDPTRTNPKPVVVPLGPRQEASGRQLSYLRVVAREVGLEPDEAAQRRYGAPTGELSRRQISELIDWLQNVALGPS